MLTAVDEQRTVQQANQSFHPSANGRDAEALATVLKDLSFALSEAAQALQHTILASDYTDERVVNGIDFYREVDHLKISLIRSALTHTNGCQKSAAKLLSIRLSTLNAMIKRFGIASRKM